MPFGLNFYTFTLANPYLVSCITPGPVDHYLRHDHRPPSKSFSITDLHFLQSDPIKYSAPNLTKVHSPSRPSYPDRQYHPPNPNNPGISRTLQDSIVSLQDSVAHRIEQTLEKFASINENFAHASVRRKIVRKSNIQHSHCGIRVMRNVSTLPAHGAELIHQ
ncbi:hypothetical protein CBL_03353 [Carabus blaptoides fortunei]